MDTRHLPQGLTFHLVKMPRLPVAAVSLVLDAGEAGMPGPEAGWGLLAGTALQGGTGQRSGDALARALEGAGSGVGVATGWDAVHLELTVLPERLPLVLPLLMEMVREPAFPQDEVKRARERRLATIRQRAMDPGALADDWAAAEIHHSDSPYARPLGGTAESIAKVEAADLVGLVERRYRPMGGTLVVAGDVEGDEVLAMLEPLLRGWEGGPLSVQAPSLSLPRSREARVVLVDRPGSVQSELRLGHVGVPRASPYHASLRVVNALLGGTFSSRLNLNLREKNGFTYGVRSRFSFRRGAGPFWVGTAVDREVTAAAVGEVLDEVRGLRDQGPTELEVASSRDYLAGVFPLQLQTVEDVAGRIGSLAVHGLPPSAMVEERDAIRGVSVEAAGEAARLHLKPEEMVVVVVGDAAVVRAPLEALGVGPVEVR
ncbi:MAG: pitrilysin family protein [Gemmatimonadota bacterium]